MPHRQQHQGQSDPPNGSSNPVLRALKDEDSLATVIQILTKRGIGPHECRTIVETLLREAETDPIGLVNAVRAHEWQREPEKALRVERDAEKKQNDARQEELTKEKYRRQCLYRCSRFQADVLNFHRSFPPIWVPENENYDGTPTVTTLRLPDWLKPLLRKTSKTLYEGYPRTFGDLALLRGLAAELAAAQNGWRILTPEDPEREGQYFLISRRDREAYTNDLQSLRQRYPDVSPTFFEAGLLREADRPWILVPNVPFDLGQWQEQVRTAAAGARLFVPIYPHTRAADLDWQTIKGQQALVYGPLSRTRENVLATRLKVWDTYRQILLFSRVAEKLHLPVSTVKRHYTAACRDIDGAPPTGPTRQRRLAGFNPETHVSECARCRRAETAEGFCPSWHDFVNREYVSLRERLSP